MTPTTDRFDPYPKGPNEIDLAILHLRLTDQMLVQIVGEDGLAKINETYNLPTDDDLTNDDGTFNAAAFIQAAECKLYWLQWLAHQAVVEAVTNPQPVSRSRGGDGRAAASWLEQARSWLKKYEFSLPAVKARHPQADPQAHRYGIAGQPPAPGTSRSFDDLAEIFLPDIED